MTERLASTDEADAAGFVLAGGQSSRMGRDKALLPFAGRPLIAHALATLREAGLPAAIAGADPAANSALAAYAPIVPDPQPGLGPLAGICAALEAASTRFAVFLPVDLPLLPSSLIAYLLHHARITGRAVTVPSVNGFAQTFPVVLDAIGASRAPEPNCTPETRLLFRFSGCGGKLRPAYRRRSRRTAGSIRPGRASFWPGSGALVPQREYSSRS